MRLINLSFKFHSISCFTEIYDERKRNTANWSPSGDIISCKSINQWWQTSVWQEFSFLYSTLEILRTAKALLIKDEQYAAFIWEITSTGNMVIEISQISGSLVTVIIRSSWPGWQNLFIKSCPLHINLHVYKPLNTTSVTACVRSCVSRRKTKVSKFSYLLKEQERSNHLSPWPTSVTWQTEKHGEKSSGTDWPCTSRLVQKRTVRFGPLSK